jgi:hypothetical protein
MLDITNFAFSDFGLFTFPHTPLMLVADNRGPFNG